eukprot:726450-Lingulodinium_polyedra.AAC.1
MALVTVSGREDGPRVRRTQSGGNRHVDLPEVGPLPAANCAGQPEGRGVALARLRRGRACRATWRGLTTLSAI